MGITLYTDGALSQTKNAAGVDVVHVVFDPDRSRTLRRHELPDGTRLATDGAVVESFGRGGPVVEIVGLDELRGRFGDDKILGEATGSCRRGQDDQGFWRCDQFNCSGTCVEKSFLFWTWCSCTG